MSVLKMVIADDRHYFCGEVHGSLAQQIYAACSRNPGSLDELGRLLPEFGAKEKLRDMFGWHSSLDLHPVDAGLIIVDLAKKWIYAENTYFSAHRRGRYQPRDGGEAGISYEFSEKWQFVAEAKWFNYLWSCDLQPYGDHKTPAPEIETGTASANPAHQDHISLRGQETSRDESAPPLELADDEPAYEDIEDDHWDDERAGIDMKFANRWMGLIYFKPQNAPEERDLQTLEHILRYEQQAEVAQYQIQQARKEIASLQIKWQAAENLWNRTAEPRWGLKRTHFQALIEQQEKRISRLADEQAEAAAMALELRALGTSGKFQEALKSWQNEDHEPRGGSEEDAAF